MNIMKKYEQKIKTKVIFHTFFSSLYISPCTDNVSKCI